MAVPLIDTHCHLDVDDFATDRAEVIARAEADNVRAMLTLGTELPSSKRAVELADQYSSVFAAVGLHPNDCAGEGPVDWAPYKKLAENPRVIAWGEIGLDYHRDFTKPERQKQVLRDQLAIARDLSLPIAVHIRKAHEDTLAILSEPAFKDVTGILHCWSGTLEQAKRGIDLGYLIGIGGPITYKKSSLPEVAAALPWNALVVETDAPYLAPVPRRGKRNEPALVRHTFDRLVEVKADLSQDEAARWLWESFAWVFGRFDTGIEQAARRL